MLSGCQTRQDGPCLGARAPSNNAARKNAAKRLRGERSTLTRKCHSTFEIDVDALAAADPDEQQAPGKRQRDDDLVDVLSSAFSAFAETMSELNTKADTGLSRRRVCGCGCNSERNRQHRHVRKRSMHHRRVSDMSWTGRVIRGETPPRSGTTSWIGHANKSGAWRGERSLEV